MCPQPSSQADLAQRYGLRTVFPMLHTAYDYDKRFK
jgi:hypothetical protein